MKEIRIELTVWYFDEFIFTKVTCNGFHGDKSLYSNVH